MADTTINVVTLEGARLALSAGDTLAIMYPGVLRPEQREHIKSACAASMPEGVKVMVFDGGVTIAAIAQDKPTRIDVTSFEGKATTEADTIRKTSKMPPWRNPAH